LDEYLDPVTLTPQVAQRLVDLQPTPRIFARVKALGEKCDAGTLTEAERDEYAALANAGTLVALLKAKARRVLARSAGV
jgi:hypothetical protein